MVDARGRFRCVRVLNGDEIAEEVVTLLLAVLETWRFEPATVGGERRVSFYSDKVELLESP